MSLKIVNPTEMCTKKGLGPSIVRRFEALGFTQIVAHDIAPLCHNTVYIFSTIYDIDQFEPKGIHLEGFPQAEIDLADSHGWKKYGIKSSSLNIPTQEPKLHDVVDTKTIRVIYTEREQQDALGIHDVGWYDPSNNVLCIPDITHNTKNRQRTIDRVEWLLNWLERYCKDNEALVKKANGEVLEAISSFMMGADIEFEIFDNGVLIGADRFYPSLHQEIGRDGHRETGELRPKPTRDPVELANRTKSLLKSIHDYLPKGYEIYCGGGLKVPIGLHIHYSGISPSRILVDAMDKLLRLPIQAHQGPFRTNSQYGGRDGEVREQPHGWEYRPLMSTLESPMMLEAVFCVAHGIAKQISIGSPISGSARGSTYRALPNYEKHKRQIDYFIKRFLDTEVTHMEGKDIRATWFDYMPELYGVRRHKFLDDDRMEWLYDQIEGAEYNDLQCNWIVNAALGKYNTPEILIIGAPRDAISKVAAAIPTLRFGIGKEQTHRHEVLFSINTQTTKRCVVDRKHAAEIGAACISVLKETIKIYNHINDSGKVPEKSDCFKRVWHGAALNRGHYRPDTGFVVIGEEDIELPDLTQLNDKDLAVLYALYREDDTDQSRKIREEIERRGGTGVELVFRGHYGN